MAIKNNSLILRELCKKLSETKEFQEFEQDEDMSVFENVEEDPPSLLLVGLKSLMMKLLQFKYEMNVLDLYDISSQNERLEEYLLKREAEIRNRIKKQNEYKVTIEEKKSRIEELEKTEVSNKSYISELQSKLSLMKIPKKFDKKKIQSEMERKLEEIEETIEKKEDRIQLIEIENGDLKYLLDEKTKELKRIKLEKRRTDSNIFSRQSTDVGISSQSIDLSDNFLKIPISKCFSRTMGGSNRSVSDSSPLVDSFEDGNALTPESDKAKGNERYKFEKPSELAEFDINALVTPFHESKIKIKEHIILATKQNLSKRAIFHKRSRTELC